MLTRALVLGALLLVTNAHREGPGPAFGGSVEEVTVSLRESGIIHRLGKVNVTEPRAVASGCKAQLRQFANRTDVALLWKYDQSFELMVSGFKPASARYLSRFCTHSQNSPPIAFASRHVRAIQMLEKRDGVLARHSGEIFELSHINRPI